jgi:zinc protease
VIALGLRIWMAYGVLGLTTALLCASVPMRTDAQSAPQGSPAVTNRNWPSERPPRPLPARSVTFPPYEIRKLTNGLQVVLVSHHEQPAVSVRMIVRAGAAQDPKGKMGLAMMTAALLDQGAGSRTAEQIADTIDFVGGILGTGAGTDLTYINTVVMNDSLPLALQLMADVVRRPTFSAQEIERQRQQAMSGLTVAAEDPDNVASQVIDRLIYGFHPYGLPGSGTADSLGTLTRQDIVDFHQRYYAPNNAIIAIVGDVAADVAIAGLEKVFGDWPSRDVPAFAPIEPPEPTKRVVVIDKPDAVQTEIRVGQLGIPRRHNDFLAMDQAVKILGGEGANRLQQVLRSQRGLTYGASADLQAYKTTGGIVAETDTRTDATAEALRLTIDEFYKLQRERVYEGELEGAQAYLAGHFPLTIETPDAIATQVLNQLFYELPLEELQTFPDRVRSVTPDDVQRVARSYFRPDRLAIVLVGNANAFVKDLKGVGFGEFERIPIGQVDLLAADLRKGGNRVGRLVIPPANPAADPLATPAR